MKVDGDRISRRYNFPDFGDDKKFVVNPTVGFNLGTDSWGDEVEILVYDVDADDTIYYRDGFRSNKTIRKSFCAPSDHCIEITIWDSYGDGLIDDEDNDGYFEYIANGQTVSVTHGGNQAGPFQINC